MLPVELFENSKLILLRFVRELGRLVEFTCLSRSTMLRIYFAVVFLAFFLVVGNSKAQDVEGAGKNRVVLMGMIHGGHRTSGNYDLDTVRKLIRAINPDLVFCEIPPDRLEEANRQFRESGQIAESRVKVFPEYVDALYPLTSELDFEIVPCAGWTKPMADARRKKLTELRVSEKEKYDEMAAAQSEAEQKIQKEGGADNPAFIHTDRYDEIVKVGMGPYSRHFNDLLGPGGWENINISHYKLIETNLDARKNQGKTILIMFGAWHKYWFKEKLRQRVDIELVNLNDYLNSSIRKK